MQAQCVIQDPDAPNRFSHTFNFGTPSKLRVRTDDGKPVPSSHDSLDWSYDIDSSQPFYLRLTTAPQSMLLYLQQEV